MTARRSWQGIELPSGELETTAPRHRSPLVTFGMGVAVLFGLIALVLVGSQFLVEPNDRERGISMVLAPPPVARPALPPAPALSVPAPKSLGGHLVADPALVEDSPFGPLPMIAPDGRAPMAAYARPFDARDSRKRIAIIVGGLNVSATQTKLALARLPPSVTLAFSPFRLDVQASVELAREAGHEVLLEVPMEPFDFPESDPGPYSLMAAASSEENLRRLSWSLSRFTGYVGVTNLLGGRFMSEQAALDPVLQEIARRGLIFLDNGASRSSLSLTAARHAKASIATGTLLLDGVQMRDAVDKKLGELEAEARRSGFAIGVGSAYPVTIARIAVWAEDLQARGLVLVPLSALATRPLP
jgi:polysaccharide deacetylase 2 family uncharacterized protein YibQ